MVSPPVGFVAVGMGLAMLVCAAVGGLYGESREATLVAVSALVTAGVGGGMVRYGRSVAQTSIRRREATLAVALIWFLAAGVFGALPFVVAAGVHPVDAFFEAISGFTTTGATILTDIEGTLGHALLLWRSLIQWLGGMGIVVLFIAVLPNLGVGGKHLYRLEVPGHTASGLQPRIRETSNILWKLYVGFTALEVAILYALGMSLFEAVCHAFTTMSTGGFSTRNASIAAFDSAPIEMVISVFMLIGGVNFGLYYAALVRRSARPLWRSGELRVYLGLAAISIALLTLTLRGNHGNDPVESLRYSIFMVATTMTSTGYGTDNYMAYPSFALTLVMALMFLGACSGSTAGGIKLSRIILLYKHLVVEVRRTLRPQVIQAVRLDGKSLSDTVIKEVSAFFFIYMLLMALGTLTVTLTDGVPPQTAFGAMLTCLSNMGPAPFHVGADNFAGYSGIAKAWFAVAMVLGRLEFFTLLAILHPDTWRHV